MNTQPPPSYQKVTEAPMQQRAEVEAARLVGLLMEITAGVSNDTKSEFQTTHAAILNSFAKKHNAINTLKIAVVGDGVAPLINNSTLNPRDPNQYDWTKLDQAIKEYHDRRDPGFKAIIAINRYLEKTLTHDQWKSPILEHKSTARIFPGEMSRCDSFIVLADMYRCRLELYHLYRNIVKLGVLTDEEVSKMSRAELK